MGVAAIDLVPVEPLRRRFEELLAEERVTAQDIAADVGWFVTTRQRGRQPNGDRVMRALGLRSYTSHSRQAVQNCVSYDTAVKLAEALGMHPVDAGV